MNIGAGRVVYQDLHPDRQGDRRRRIRAQPGARRRGRAPPRRPAALHVLGLLSPGGVHSHESQIAAMVDMAAAAGVTDVACTPSSTAATRRRKSAAASLALHASDAARGIAAGAHRLDLRPLLRDGPRQALGARARPGLRPRSTRGTAHYRRRRGRRRSTPPTRAARPTSSSQRPRSAGAARQPVAMRRRRRRRVHELPRRPCARAHPRAHRRRRSTASRARAVPQLGYFCTLTSYGEDFAHLPVAFAPQSIGNGFGEYLAGARPDAAAHRRDREVRARHLLLQRRRRDALSRRGPRAGALAQGRHLRPEAGDERRRGHRQAGRRRSAAAATTSSSATTPTATWSATPATSPRRSQAIEALDACVGRVVEAMRAAGGEVLITADHGNAEMMHDPRHRQAHTAHTINLVPLRLRRPHGAARDRRRAAPTSRRRCSR